MICMYVYVQDRQKMWDVYIDNPLSGLQLRQVMSSSNKHGRSERDFWAQVTFKQISDILCRSLRCMITGTCSRCMVTGTYFVHWSVLVAKCTVLGKFFGVPLLQNLPAVCAGGISGTVKSWNGNKGPKPWVLCSNHLVNHLLNHLAITSPYRRSQIHANHSEMQWGLWIATHSSISFVQKPVEGDHTCLVVSLRCVSRWFCKPFGHMITISAEFFRKQFLQMQHQYDYIWIIILLIIIYILVWPIFNSDSNHVGGSSASLPGFGFIEGSVMETDSRMSWVS